MEKLTSVDTIKNSSLRETLTRIVEDNGDGNWWKPQEFEMHVRSQLPVELHMLSAPPNESENYNCFAYALGLNSDTEFQGGRNPVQKEFIRYLIAKNLLKVTPKGETGDLVFYETEDGTISHGGVIQGNKVVSKWSWGPLFEHKLEDVPSSYGKKVFYAKPIKPQEAKNAYFAYRESGVKITPIS